MMEQLSLDEQMMQALAMDDESVASEEDNFLIDPMIAPGFRHRDEQQTVGRRKPFVVLAFLGICGLLAAVLNDGGAHLPLRRGSTHAALSNDEAKVISSESAGALNKKPVHIIYSSDDEALPGVEASIISVLEHASGPVVIHYIGQSPLPTDYPEVHFKDLNKFAKRFKLHDFMNTAFTRGHGQGTLNTNAANFVRFGIEAMLPTQSKALWIDADTIVNCDVYELINGSLNDNKYALAAVPRYGSLHGLTHEGDEMYKDIQVSFNAGIFVMNLDNWRAQGLTEKIRQIALRNRQEPIIYQNGSQPPMAIAIGENFEHLPESWNVAMDRVEDANDEFLSNTCMMHWNGPYKPWFENKPEHQFHEELWMAYGIAKIDKPCHHAHCQRKDAKERKHAK